MNQRSPVSPSFMLPPFLLTVPLFGSLALIFFLLVLSPFSLAQSRPRLKPLSRDYFAGRFLLVPRNDKPSSLRQPGMIAEIADHYLITPPVRLLEDPKQLIDWVKTVDDQELDGAIISLDAISDNLKTGANPGRLALISELRAHRPGIPIYGYLTVTGSSGPENDQAVESPAAQAALSALSDGSLDYLLIGGDLKSRGGQSSASLARLKSEVESRRLAARIWFTDDPETGAISLLARMINLRFGFVPRILPIYSSSAAREAVPNGSSLPLHRLISEKIRVAGGAELPQSSESARNADLFWFVYPQQIRDSERAALVEALAKTADQSVRIALIDLSETRESRDALMNELRRHKLLDKFIAYAGLDAVRETPGDALTRSLGQAMAFLASVRFLRDDLERVRRFDRAQESLLIGRYLSDWIYPYQLRPKFAAYLTGQPQTQSLNPVSKTEMAEAYLLNLLKPLAEDLFGDQFRRNTHSFLMSNGERAQFEVRLIQRLIVRLSGPPGSQAAGRWSPEIDLKPSIHLVHLGSESVPQLRTQKLWELRGDVDERVGRRWESVDWPFFKTDADSVEMVIKVTAKPDPAPGAQVNYTIVCKRSRNLRRIEIDASSPEAAFDAIGKLERMGAEGRLARDFQINERPAVAQRAMIESFSASWWSHRDRLEVLRFLGRLRMNRYYYLPNAAGQSEEQREREDEKIQELLRVADENFIQLVYGINLDGQEVSAGSQKPESIENRLDRLSQLGVRRFVICFNNAASGQQSGNYQERLKRLIDEQSLLIGRIREYLRRSGEAELSVWPKLIAGSGNRLDYIKGLAAAIPQDVKILMEPEAGSAGTIEPSRRIDLHPISRNESMDGPGYNWTLCLSPRPDDSQALAIVAANRVQLTKLMLATLSESAWDGRGYNQERAFASAMSLLYDERTRAGLQVWSQLIGDCRNTENRSGQKLAELRSALELMSGTRERGLLRGELADAINQ